MDLNRLMMKGIGTDILEVARIEEVVERHGRRFLDRLFTEKEQEYCEQHRDTSQRFTARFAAKEAVAKALGVGFGNDLSFLDIEILPNERGKPVVSFSEKARKRFGDPQVQVSISHCKQYAVASAVWVL